MTGDEHGVQLRCQQDEHLSSLNPAKATKFHSNFKRLLDVDQ